ncbi:hypothetical protein QN277_011752 [Acacia crassicarpa]|uniref:Uncharacterized protein n=1 Tax=Acacia crassicarpa TaxID=499986 RepID=A0AAE1N018_9FABA|nr:hypothetical protein QN277_011752 [Acacia crassicarpa]
MSLEFHFGVSLMEIALARTVISSMDNWFMVIIWFKGKFLLIVHVASRCGLTSSNYSELSHIYEKYKAQGLGLCHSKNKATRNKAAP